MFLSCPVLFTTHYELTNYLGNVLTTVTGRKMGIDDGSGIASHYEPEVLMATDYFPFGQSMPGRDYKNSDFMGTNDYRFAFNGKEHDSDGEFGSLTHYDYGFRIYNPAIGKFLSVDPLASEMPAWAPFSAMFNNPIRFVDPDGLAPFDWVQRGDGSIYWDNNANSQATTNAGETYLGTSLTFSFNSYIDAGLWDGPGGSGPAGDKLTSTVTLTASENSAGELTRISASSDIAIGSTPIGTARDYFPGLGADQNKFEQSQSNNADGTLGSYSLNFEQHASVSPIEQFGLNFLGFDIVNVAQKLNVGTSGGNLSISAGTDVFPSATLSVNGGQLFQYNQPSFRATHGRDSRTVIGDNSRGGSTTTATTSRRPSPRFYKRY